MDIWAVLKGVGEKIAIVSSVVVGVIAILEKLTPIKLWTWLKKRRENSVKNTMLKFSKSTDEKFAAITQTLDALRLLIVKNRVEEIKFNILDFANAIYNGKKVSLDQFEAMDKMIHEYDTNYIDHHNGELKDAIEFIHEQKRIFVKNHIDQVTDVI